MCTRSPYSSTDFRTRLSLLILPTLHAFRTYWPAVLLMQFCASILVLSYYQVDGAAAAVFEKTAEWRTRGGLLFVAAANILSGGVFPELVKRVFRPKGVRPPTLPELGHQFVMWAALGVFVDVFYRVQAVAFGDDLAPGTIIVKIVVDQFLFTPLIPLPFIAAWFILFEKNYNLKLWIKALTLRRMCARILPLWTTVLCFWPLTLAVLYALPVELQFSLFLFANAAFSILMIFVARRQTVAE